MRWSLLVGFVCWASVAGADTTLVVFIANGKPAVGAEVIARYCGMRGVEGVRAMYLPTRVLGAPSDYPAIAAKTFTDACKTTGITNERGELVLPDRPGQVPVLMTVYHPASQMEMFVPAHGQTPTRMVVTLQLNK